MYRDYKEIYKNVILSSYSEERKYFDKVVSLWVFYVTRPISFLITPIFIFLKVTPNQASFIGLVIGIISIVYGSLGFFFLGSFFYNIFLIFDSVDGNIARYDNCSNQKGEYYDAIIGDLVNILFLPSIGFGLLKNPTLCILDINILELNLFNLSLCSSLLICLTSLAAQRKKVIFNKFDKKPYKIGLATKISIYEIVLRNSFGWQFNAPISILVTLIGPLDIFIYYNLFMSAIVFAYIVKVQ